MALLPKLTNQLGYSLVELLVAIALFGILVPILFSGFIATRDSKPQQEQRLQAAAMLRETTEALRVIRANSWTAFATNGVWHPFVASGTWTLVAGPETVNGYTRKLTISDVYRNSAGTIVTVGGTLDPSTKKVVVEVDWNTPLVTSVDSTFYLSRYLDNLTFTHTTQADFNLTGSVLDNTVVVADGGGAVRLSPSGPGNGNWCVPSIVGQLDLPRNGAARATTAIVGQVFSGTGLNASGVSLAYTTVSDAVPPVPTLAGTFDGYKTNDVFGTTGYGFLATDNNAKEVVIVNTSTMTQAGYFDIPGVASARSIYVKDSTGYVIAGNTLYLFSVAPVLGSSSQPSLGSVTLAGNGTSIYVVGTDAYVTIDATTNQLQIINVSNTSSPSVTSSLTLNALQGRDVYVYEDGQWAYVATATSASQAEFFVINVSNKASPISPSSYDTNGMDPQAVDVVLDNNVAIIVGVGGNEYQVARIDNKAVAPVACGSLNEDSGIYDIATVVEDDDNEAYAYISSGNSSSELKIIEGGPGGSYALTGTYTSAIVDIGSTTAFNRLTVDGVNTANTTLRYQVAAALPVAGSCAGATYAYVGPDGTASSYFTGEAAIPFNSDGSGYENPARCFRYQALFSTTNTFESPVFNSIIVNYSP